MTNAKATTKKRRNEEKRSHKQCEEGKNGMGKLHLNNENA